MAVVLHRSQVQFLISCLLEVGKGQEIYVNSSCKLKWLENYISHKLDREWSNNYLPGDAPPSIESCMSICELTPIALSLLLILPALPLRVMACCMRGP